MENICMGIQGWISPTKCTRRGATSPILVPAQGRIFSLFSYFFLESILGFTIILWVLIIHPSSFMFGMNLWIDYIRHIFSFWEGGGVEGVGRPVKKIKDIRPCNK